MIARTLIRGILIGVCAAALVAVGSLPAFAQNSSLRGRIVDVEGNPVAGATVVIRPLSGDFDVEWSLETNEKGEFFKGALRGYGGVFRINVTKDELSGAKSNIRVALGGVTSTDDIIIKPAGLAEFESDASNLSAEEIEARNAENARLEAAFTAANAAFEAGDFDLAIDSVNTVMAMMESDCFECHVFLADIQLKKGDEAAAEAEFLKASEIKPDDPAPYNGLADIYNTQRKFEEAAAMSAKASEVTGGAAAGAEGAEAGGGGGGGSAESSYNQGISLWNAGKAPEAQIAFERAIELDDKMADAHYWLGMAFVNQGKLKEAKVPFETYLKLEPDGENAATATALLAQIGG
jgi:tetratricopeptide (TPR) repeat protein